MSVTDLAQQEVLNNPLLENQERDPLTSSPTGGTRVGMPFFTIRIPTGPSFPAWWTPARDEALRRIAMSNDYMAIAVYNMVTKISSIPIRIEARDPTVRSHVAQAERMTMNLTNASQRFSGWRDAYQMWITDFLTQDNGGFMLIIGPGKLDGPMTGEAVAVEHLDAARCTRTGNATYPVVFESENGKKFKLHKSRVMFRSQMTSPIQQAYGLGFCAVSRVLHNAMILDASMQFKLEKLGARPARGLLAVEGMDGPAVFDYFAMSEEQSKAEELGFFSYWTVLANQVRLKVERIDLTSLPDGENQVEMMRLYIYLIAAGFGFDAQELLPSSDVGGTRAGVLMQHIKARGKGPADVVVATETMMEKFVPPHLKAVMDNQDDEADRASEEINELRSKSQHLDIKNKIINQRVSRYARVEAGSLSKESFEELELGDGRLPDGSDVIVMFNSPDAEVQKLLDLGIKNPTSVRRQTNLLSILDKIDDQLEVANTANFIAGTRGAKQRTQQVIAALTKLKGMYEDELQKREAAALALAANPRPDSGNAPGNSVDAKPTPTPQGERTPERTVEDSALPNETAPPMKP